MYCDMHVHTRASGMCTVPVFDRFCRESYSDPLEVYATLKRRGMDLVTVTDHDAVDALDQLARFSDFFLSEEVTCRLPSGTMIHVGVFDVDERQHIEIQRRRDDVVSLIHYLTGQSLFFSLNHAFSGLTGRRRPEDYDLFESHFPALEALNGQMSTYVNRAASSFAARFRKVTTAGSDAHTVASLGLTYTEVRGARNKSEFLDGLRSGRGRVCGEAGNYRKLTRAVWEIGCHLIAERSAARCLAPLLLAVPAVTLAICVHEFAFALQWAGRAGVRSPGSAAAQQAGYR
jgi:predicted metal-dependent phosphoesterase TrpH